MKRKRGRFLVYFEPYEAVYHRNGVPKRKGRDAATVTRLPPLALFRLGVLEVSFFLPLCFPRRELPLALLALVEREDVRQEAPGEFLDLVLRDVGVVYELFPTTQCYLLCSAMLVVMDERCHVLLTPFWYDLKPGSAGRGAGILPLRVLRPESLADSGTLRFYFSTLRPMPFGVLSLLPPLGYGFAIVTVFRPVGAGDKHSAADRALLHGVLAEYLRF